MSIRIERPYPVAAHVVMRSSLFALANMGAKLQAYNEETGVIVATVTRRMGLQKDEMAVRVRPFADLCQVEIEAPDPERAHEFLGLVSNYVRDGSKVHSNATMQWVDMQRQAESQARRTQLINKAKSLLPGSKPTDSAIVPANDTAVASALVTAEENQALARMPIPDNPGVLVKNPQDRLVEIKIDTAVFTDRTDHLQLCQSCQAVVLRGSLYCSNCARPLTLEAVQPELRTGAKQAAQGSLTFSLIAFGLSLVPFLILVLPVLLNDSSLGFLDKLDEWISPLKIGLSLLLGVLPAIVLGFQATARARQATWYMNLRATVEANGRVQTSIGSALGWLAIYLSISWVLFIGLVWLQTRP